MSTYNDAEFLPEAMQSVLGQSFNDFEFLIVDDNSSDTTKNILADYQVKDPRIIFWSNPVNQGLTKNLNAALAKARGEFMARLDSDDAWLDKNKLKKQLDFLDKNPNYCLVGCWAEVCGPKNKKLYDLKYPAGDGEIREQLLVRNCFVHSGILARTNAVKEAGVYGAGRQYIEDYALWLELGKRYKFGNIPEIMVSYRVNDLGITRTKNKEQIKAVLSLIKEYRNAYPNYALALLKWSLQYALSFVGLTGRVNVLKKIFKKEI